MEVPKSLLRYDVVLSIISQPTKKPFQYVKLPIVCPKAKLHLNRINCKANLEPPSILPKYQLKRCQLIHELLRGCHGNRAMHIRLTTRELFKVPVQFSERRSLQPQYTVVGFFLERLRYFMIGCTLENAVVQCYFTKKY